MMSGTFIIAAISATAIVICCLLMLAFRYSNSKWRREYNDVTVKNNEGARGHVSHPRLALVARGGKPVPNQEQILADLRRGADADTPRTRAS